MAGRTERHETVGVEGAIEALERSMREEPQEVTEPFTIAMLQTALAKGMPSYIDVVLRQRTRFGKERSTHLGLTEIRIPRPILHEARLPSDAVCAVSQRCQVAHSSILQIVLDKRSAFDDLRGIAPKRL